jgi:hypothetical protein
LDEPKQDTACSNRTCLNVCCACQAEMVVRKPVQY